MSTTEPLLSLEDQIRRRLRQSALMAYSFDELERTIRGARSGCTAEPNPEFPPHSRATVAGLADALAANLVDLTRVAGHAEA